MLKRLGLLKLNIKVKGEIIWRSNYIIDKGEINGNAILLVNTLDDNMNIELEYIYNNRIIKYQIQLGLVPSNLGKGQIIFFICPVTSKRCSKLYLHQGYFLSRFAISSHYYQQQLLSKRARNFKLFTN